MRLSGKNAHDRFANVAKAGGQDGLGEGWAAAGNVFLWPQDQMAADNVSGVGRAPKTARFSLGP